MANARGMIAVDKMGTKVLFVNPATYETEVVLDGFEKTVHELLVVPETNRAYVPIFGDGIHGRNPNPQHMLCVFDLEKRALIDTIDLRPYIAPHTLKLGPDGLIYMTCENSAVVVVIDRKTHTVVEAIDSGSTNAHRMIISPDGTRIYTENEEDGEISLIDLPRRKLHGKVKTPQALAGITVSGDGKTVVVVSDEEPALFLIDTGTEAVREKLPLKDVESRRRSRATMTTGRCSRSRA
jgi:DNA-binding beta-propeller fold protein YncE